MVGDVVSKYLPLAGRCSVDRKIRTTDPAMGPSINGGE